MSTSSLSPDAPHAVSRRHVTLAGARAAIAAAREHAQREGVRVSVAVVDRSGELVAFERDDDAAPVTPQVAQEKARTAALLRAPSKLFEDFINGGRPSFLSTPGLTPLQGGVPLTAGDEVIGAVGVSGGNGEQDTDIAVAAAAALHFD
ncbi:GlcG/HbpS family heme-binding protein [Pseudomonas aeruginosa]|uniref:GlcG/HbpS family heme-binding protein n=1 Tax=Pseudomonas aeruginosa TaxID=287 RepID=UPI0027482355|nr:heme-binding protein [Pseudomonas aeruginosa]